MINYVRSNYNKSHLSEDHKQMYKHIYKRKPFNVNSFYLSYQYQGKSILRKRMEIQEEKMMAFFCFLARKQRKKVILWFLAKTKVKKNHNY